MTRHERRNQRQRRFVTRREAQMAARLARLDYKVTENGARPFADVPRQLFVK